ncbi:MAG: Crp/Fnr family transcriptional regulator [Christensenellaceae bacterium]|jgi:CRP-like cAMP-binding protein
MELSQTQKATLQKNPLFGGIDAATMADILAAGKIKQYEKDTLIPTTALLGFVLQGRARIEQNTEESHPSILDYIGPPRVFGPAQLFLENVVLSKIRALSALTLFTLSKEVVEQLLDASPVFRKNYIAYLSSRIAFLTGRIASFTSPTVEDRLLSYLQEQADENGVYHVGSFTALASLLHIGRASLYRALEQLKEKEQLTVLKKTITLNLS